MAQYVANLASELIPVPGYKMLTGKLFTAAQVPVRHCTHVYASVVGGAVTVTTDGTDPDEVGAAVHTIPEGSNFTWRREMFLAARFSGAGSLVVSLMTMG